MGKDDKDWDFQQGGDSGGGQDLDIRKAVLDDDDLFAIPDDIEIDDSDEEVLNTDTSEFDENISKSSDDGESGGTKSKVASKQANKTPSKPEPKATAPSKPTSAPKPSAKESKATPAAKQDTSKGSQEKSGVAPPKKEVENKDKNKSSSSVPDVPEMAASMSSYPVLVVDDDKWIQKIFKQYLETWGFEYIGASNSIEGLKAAIKHKPLAIFLDIVMPDVYGDITLKFIKGFEESKSSPVVIISGNLSKNVLRQTYQDGAIGFITKPFTKETLQDKVLSVIRKSVLNRMKEDGVLKLE